MTEPCQICEKAIDVDNGEYLSLTCVTPISEHEVLFCSASCLCEGAWRIRDSYEKLSKSKQ
jgi:hypothetical protein